MPKHNEVTEKIYDNTKILNPDGSVLCFTEAKRARFYLNKNLAEKISDDPLVIKLTFTPKGPGSQRCSYLLEPRENKCVVCGSVEDLTRHHVVPHCYRKHFPENMKSHQSYDILAVCFPCHNKYEKHADKLKKELAGKYGVVVEHGLNKRERAYESAISAARTLIKYGEDVPSTRKEVLISRVKEIFGDEDIESVAKYPRAMAKALYQDNEAQVSIIHLGCEL